MYSDEPFWVRALVALLNACWLGVFLMPLSQLGLLNQPQSFVLVFVVLVLAEWISYWPLRIIAFVIVNIGYTVYFYAPEQVSWMLAFNEVFHQESSNVRSWLSGGGLREPLQTQLFIISVCLLYWVVQYVCRKPRLWLFYNLLALVVLGVVDGNTTVHPNISFVAVLLIGLTLRGLYYYLRLEPSLLVRGRPLARYFIPLVALLLLTSLAAFALPKQQAVWSNPVAGWKTPGNGRGTGQATRFIGYQTNNDHLGGAFEADNTPVLSVVSPYPTYLRGQAYSNYTGKGWIEQSSDLTPAPVGQFLAEGNRTSYQNLPSKKLNVKIQVLSSTLHANVLFTPYAADLIKSLTGIKDNVQPNLDLASGTIFSAVQAGESYDVESRSLLNPALQLKAATNTSQPTGMAAYLELPASLPQRVSELATKITAGDSNEYQKTVSIVNYLQLNYPYETTKIPVPSAKQDYVDQFLFESKKGYCNNFSSSLAVLLRTLGIPTRWVIGFAPGSNDTSYTGSESRFIVRSSDAHSWVEVYFPGSGWVPFDATPGFSMSFAPDNSPSTNPQTVKTPAIHAQPTPAAKIAGKQADGHVAAMNWHGILVWLAWIVGILAVMAALFAAIFQRKIRIIRHHWEWSHDSPIGMARGLRHLVKLLIRFGELPSKGTTIRDLQAVANSYGIDKKDYQTLVKTAEVVWYGGEQPQPEQVAHAKSIWREWIERIIKR